MKKIIFLLCLKLLAISQLFAQCAEIIPLTNGDFSNFTGPTVTTSFSCEYPTPPYVSGTSATYFSSPNLPNWKRINGTPNAWLGHLNLKTIADPVAVGSGGSWCQTYGSQAVAANYPFLKNGKYEITVDFYGWDNHCHANGDDTFDVYAVSGLSEPTTPSDVVVYDGPGSPAKSVFYSNLRANGVRIGHWEPAHDAGGALPQVFASGPLPASFDQLFIGVNQVTSSFISDPDNPSLLHPVGFGCILTSVKVKLCNECPTATYLINSNVAPDPVTGMSFSAGGVFMDALIKIDGPAPLTNNPGENTLLTARSITANYPMNVGHAFLATANMGRFFEMAPSAGCPVKCDLPPIVGRDTLCQDGELTYTDANPGGSWTSSNPALISINPASGGVYASLTDTGTATITYTVGSCSVYKTITVISKSPYCAHLKSSGSIFATNKEMPAQNDLIQVYPNPTQDQINISYPCKSAGQLEISIKDVSGRVRYTESVVCDKGGNVQHSINTGNFQPGVYFIELSLNDQHIVKKIVKIGTY